jgi:PST family polysaccharide transporter
MGFKNINLAVKKTLKSPEQALVFKNFLSLGIMQLLNLLIPIFLIPYLVRVVGVDSVGDINFAQSVMTYFTVLVTFGYNYTGTKNVSVSEGKQLVLSKIYSEAMSFRFILLLTGSLILLLLIIIVPTFNSVKYILLLSYGAVIFQYLFPVWFFQGLQKMKYILLINSGVKILTAISLIYFVKDKGDILLIPFLTSLFSIIGGICALLIIRFRFCVKLSFSGLLTLASFKKSYNEGKNVFLQQLYVCFYGPINIVFLAMLTNSTAVGYFTIVEKLISIPTMFIGMAAQAYYPYAVKVFQISTSRYFSQVKIMCGFLFIISLSMMILYYLFGDFIIRFFLYDSNDTIKYIFFILTLGICFGSFGQFLTQIFVTIKCDRFLNKLSLFIMIGTLILSPIIISSYGVVGLACLVVIRQLLTVTICFIYLKGYKKKYEAS